MKHKDALDETIQSLAETLGHTPTLAEFTLYSEYTPDDLPDDYDAYLRDLGLDPTEQSTPPSTTHRVATDTLIQDVHRVADELGHPPSTTEYNNLGNHHHRTIINRLGFSSWVTTLNELGYDYTPPEPQHRSQHIPDLAALATILQHADEQLPNEPLTQRTYLRAVDLDPTIYHDLSTDHWYTFLQNHDLSHRIDTRRATEDDLEHAIRLDIETYYETHGRKPKLNELSHSTGTITRVYGSLDDAIKHSRIHRELLLDELGEFHTHHGKLTKTLLKRATPTPIEEYEAEFGSLDDAIDTYYDERTE
jgi:hypothetical protein